MTDHPWKRNAGPVAAALAAALLFGLAAPASKLILREASTFQLAGLLYIGGAFTLLLPVLRKRGGRTLDRRTIGLLAGVTVSGGILGPLALLSGLQLASATAVSLWLNIEVAATAVLGRLFFREHVGGVGWLGIAGMTLAGAILSGAEGGSGTAAALLVTLACFCWALDNHLSALTDRMTAPEVTFWKCLVAGVVNFLIGSAMEPFTMSAAALGASFAIGALSYGASITLHLIAAQHLGASRAQAFFGTAPFFGVAVSALVLGEPFSNSYALVCALMVVSLAAALVGQHEHVHSHPAVAHTHVHGHDDGHHGHEHAEPGPAVHDHWHEHAATTHRHWHWPDLHHRHTH